MAFTMREDEVMDHLHACNAFIEDGGEPWNVVGTEIEWLGHPIDVVEAIREAGYRL